MRILLACDKFKGTLTSPQVAEALTPPLTAAGHDVTAVPIADGGDGTVAAAAAAGFSEQSTTVTGPLGSPVTARWARSGATAIVELAEASGLALLTPTRDTALNAGTQGTGEVIAAALDAGCTRIVLAVGGSSSTDGGAGMLKALGVRFLDDAGQPVPPGGLGLLQIAHIDITGLDRRIRDAEIILASDVDNPLLGPNGAAAVYGPQKGATATEVELLDRALAHLAARLAEATTADPEMVAEATGTSGAGAAGGTGFGALAALAARVQPGADFMMELVGFDEALASAELVITGEGRFDQQTLSGKGPGAVISRAHDAGVPVWVVCGTSDVDGVEGVTGIIELRSLAPEDVCMTRPAVVLRQAGERLAELIRA